MKVELGSPALMSYGNGRVFDPSIGLFRDYKTSRNLHEVSFEALVRLRVLGL